MTEMANNIISSFWKENQENLLASIQKGFFFRDNIPAHCLW
jgi:hypothetical protein